MKYFVLYVSDDTGYYEELFLKGKTREHIEDRIQHYSDGALSTNKWTLFTSNTSSGFLREINPSEFPELLKKNFGIINENRSYANSELKGK